MLNRDIDIAGRSNGLFQPMVVGSLPARACVHVLIHKNQDMRGKRSPVYRGVWVSRTRTKMTGMS